MDTPQVLPNKSRAVIALVLFWLAVAAIALWSLRPAQPDVVLPDGWRRVAPELQVQGILTEGETVWIAGIGGLVLADAEGRTRAVTVDGTGAEPMLRAIARAGEGRIWVAHGNGLTRLDSDGGGAFHALEGPGSPMRALALDGAGKLWAGGDDGLFRIAPDGKVTPIALPQPDITVTALLADTGGGLWIGTVKRGLMRYDGGTWSLWGVAEGLPHPQVTALMRDQGGRVWAGTGFYSRGGAVRLDPGADGWRIGKVLTGADLAGAKVRSLYQDAAGRMWFGHEYDGLTIRQDGRSVAMIGLQDGLPDAEVTTILSDGAGGVWIGTLKGALHLPAQTVERLISAKPGESNDA